MFDLFGSGLLTIIAFIAMLGGLVVLHELGHFWTARRLGIRVEEFGIGFPPRAAVLFERDGVKYTLNWLPIGGFVRFGGDAESVYGVGSLSQAAPWKKIAVLLAGPLMNLFAAIAIFVGIFSIYGIPTPNGAAVGTVYPDTPAALAGLQNGDIIVGINNTPITENIDDIRTIGQQNIGQAIPLTVLRGDREQTLSVIPGPWTNPNGQQVTGFGFGYDGARLSLVRAGPLEAIGLGFTFTWDLLGRFIQGMGQLIGGLFGINPAPAGGVTGVVGIARATGEVIQSDGWLGFWRWTALISLNLFFVNLLPIPALDGSHIMFSLIEMIRRGKKIPPEREAIVHAIGFVMLMGLMVVVTISDIANWIGGGSVLGN